MWSSMWSSETNHFKVLLFVISYLFNPCLCVIIIVIINKKFTDPGNCYWKLSQVLLYLPAPLKLSFNQIFIACLFKGSQEQSSFFQTLLFTAFLVTVLKILKYVLVST